MGSGEEGAMPALGIEDAVRLAARGHRNDLWGENPYMVHLALVAQKVQSFPGAGEHTVIVAWLHDLLEDHPEYEGEIQELFPQQWSTLRLLARERNTRYLDYIRAIIDSEDEDAKLVKRADLLVNLENDPPRPELAERYRAALGLMGHG